MVCAFQPYLLIGKSDEYEI
jgi:hypothetical protein